MASHTPDQLWLDQRALPLDPERCMWLRRTRANRARLVRKFPPTPALTGTLVTTTAKRLPRTSYGSCAMRDMSRIFCVPFTNFFTAIRPATGEPVDPMSPRRSTVSMHLWTLSRSQ